MAKLPPRSEIPKALLDLLDGAHRAGAEVRIMDANDLLGDAKTIKPIPEARVMELKAVAELYHAPNPHKVGDLVHPRKNCGLIGHGTPHIVVESLGAGIRRWDGNPAGGDYGKMVDIRVLGLREGPDGDSIIPWWGEHYQYEPFSLDAKYDTED